MQELDESGIIVAKSTPEYNGAIRQHQADIEAVKGVVNPYGLKSWHTAFEYARVVILNALQGKEEDSDKILRALKGE